MDWSWDQGKTNITFSVSECKEGLVAELKYDAAINKCWNMLELLN